MKFSDGVLSNFDQTTGKYENGETLLKDLHNFWGGTSKIPCRNLTFKNRPAYLKEAGEMFLLYELVEGFNGFDLIENEEDAKIERWNSIAAQFRNNCSRSMQIDADVLRQFYKDVINPCIHLAETSIIEKKFHSPYEYRQVSIPQLISELFGPENVLPNSPFQNVNPTETPTGEVPTFPKLNVPPTKAFISKKELKVKQPPKKTNYIRKRVIKTFTTKRYHKCEENPTTTIIILEQELTSPSKLQKMLDETSPNEVASPQSIRAVERKTVRSSLKNLTNNISPRLQSQVVLRKNANILSHSFRKRKQNL